MQRWSWNRRLECAVYWVPPGTRLDGRGDELREATVSLGAASTLRRILAIAPGPFLVAPLCRIWDSWLEQITLAGLFNLTGANCLAKSPLGRTPLHVVAAMGRTDCIQPLLEHGASIHDKDLKNDTPVTIARRLKRGNLERKLFLLYWTIKSGNRNPNLAGRDVSEKSTRGS